MHKQTYFYKMLILVVIISFAFSTQFIIKTFKVTNADITPTLFISDLADTNFYATNNYIFFTRWVDSTKTKRVLKKLELSTNIETAVSSQTNADIFFQYSQYNWVNDQFCCWLDSRNSISDPTLFDIFITDLSTNTERCVTNNPADRACLNLSDKWVSYVEYGTNNPGVYVCDISNQNNTPFLVHSINDQQCIETGMDTYNNVTYLVYEDKNDDKWDIILYNCTTTQSITIASSSLIERYPKVQSGYVAYITTNMVSASVTKSSLNSPSVSSSVMLYNISSGVTTTILQLGSYDDCYINTNQSLIGNKIIINKYHTNPTTPAVRNFSIYSFDPTNGLVELINDTNSLFLSSQANASNTVYLLYLKLDSSSYNSNVYLFNYNNQTFSQITNDSSYKFALRVNNLNGFFTNKIDDQSATNLYIFDL